MKFVVLLSFFVVILQFCSAGHINKDCGDYKACTHTGNVCGELKTYNVCQKFKSACLFEYSKCTDNFKYVLVQNSRCDGFKLGHTGACRSGKSNYQALKMPLQQYYPSKKLG